MSDSILNQILSTLSDHRLSRSERSALQAVLAERRPTERQQRVLRSQLFDVVRERLRDRRDAEILTWLEDVLKLLLPVERVDVPPSRAWFGPDDPMVETVLSFIEGTQSQLDVAVFTITDNRIGRALMALHRRGVRLRIITDDEKSHDMGSDVRLFEDAGLNVRVDNCPHHFHHKFAIRDGRLLLNGSYNWTRGADMHNRENITITHEVVLVDAFSRAFEAMWRGLVG